VAGSVGVSAGVLRSASSRLFYWVRNAIARHTNDVDLAAHLNEIDRENLGRFGLDIAPGQRHEVRRIITEHLAAVARNSGRTEAAPQNASENSENSVSGRRVYLLMKPLISARAW
jgi:hypothetical protein